ncbi:hypothetical protein C5167_041551, partial [Papaver somniferum]
VAPIFAILLIIKNGNYKVLLASARQERAPMVKAKNMKQNLEWLPLVQSALKTFVHVYTGMIQQHCISGHVFRFFTLNSTHACSGCKIVVLATPSGKYGSIRRCFIVPKKLV